MSTRPKSHTPPASQPVVTYVGDKLKFQQPPNVKRTDNEGNDRSPFNTWPKEWDFGNAYIPTFAHLQNLVGLATHYMKFVGTLTTEYAELYTAAAETGRRMPRDLPMPEDLAKLCQGEREMTQTDLKFLQSVTVFIQKERDNAKLLQQQLVQVVMKPTSPQPAYAAFEPAPEMFVTPVANLSVPVLCETFVEAGTNFIQEFAESVQHVQKHDTLTELHDLAYWADMLRTLSDATQQSWTMLNQKWDLFAPYAPKDYVRFFQILSDDVKPLLGKLDIILQGAKLLAEQIETFGKSHDMLQAEIIKFATDLQQDWTALTEMPVMEQSGILSQLQTHHKQKRTIQIERQALKGNCQDMLATVEPATDAQLQLRSEFLTKMGGNPQGEVFVGSKIPNELVLLQSCERVFSSQRAALKESAAKVIEGIGRRNLLDAFEDAE